MTLTDFHCHYHTFALWTFSQHWKWTNTSEVSSWTQIFVLNQILIPWMLAHPLFEPNVRCTHCPWGFFMTLQNIMSTISCMFCCYPCTAVSGLSSRGPASVGGGRQEDKGILLAPQEKGKPLWLSMHAYMYSMYMYVYMYVLFLHMCLGGSIPFCMFCTILCEGSPGCYCCQTLAMVFMLLPDAYYQP